MNPLTAIRALGILASAMQATDFDPKNKPTGSASSKRRYATYCGCGQRISANKSSCLACKNKSVLGFLKP